MQAARVRSLVGELGSHKPCSVAKGKIKIKTLKNKSILYIFKNIQLHCLKIDSV